VFTLLVEVRDLMNHLRTVENEAYSYAGLAFGVVLANVSGR
jgi:hypothetical protein